MLNVRDSLPLFEALDSDGNPITSDDLLGSFSVLYFYPKDDTPSCTKEACDFRDTMEQFDDKGVLLLGISPDSAKSHQQFSQKYGLNFPLLCDERKDLCRLFGVLKEKETTGQKYISVERTTFITDEKGIIRWLERPVNVEGHSQRVVKALEELEQFR